MSVTAGAFIFAVSINVFLAPNNIAPGGISGLSTAINYLNPHLHIGVMSFMFNLPIFWIGYKSMGRRFVITSMLVTFMCSVFLEVTALFPRYTEDRMLSALFGGVLLGAGLGMVMRCGTTTGGTDILVRVLHKKNPSLSLGSLVFVFDLIVVAFAAAVYRELTSALYALIAIFVSSLVLDRIVSGADDGKLAYIMSSKTDELAGAISKSLGRGLTLLHAKGYYTGTEKDVIMIVIRRYQLSSLRRIVSRIDPDAFMIFSDAAQVVGEGFSVKE